MSLAESRQVGERAESTAVELLPIEYVGDGEAEHYDAVLTESVEGFEAGAAVEIKSAAVVISGDRPGMWYLRQAQHDPLVESDGLYLLLVCTPNADRRILGERFLAAETVAERLIPSWWPGAGSRSPFRQIPWTLVFDESDLEERGRR